LRSRSGGGRTSGPGTTGGGPRGSPTPLEVPLWLPLEPWKRPLEQDTFKFMRNIVLYRQWKDFDYQVARDRSITQRRGKLQAPVNYLGPSTLPTGEDAKAVAERRKAYLAQIFSCLAIAENKAPRPLIEQLLLRIREALALPEGGRHPLLDEVELTQHHLGILQELSAPSWNEIQTEYAKLDPQSDQDAQQNRAHLIQFEYELHQILPDRDMSIMDNLPWWEPAAAPASSPNANDIFQQIQYNGSTSRTGLNLAGLSLKINSPRRRVGAPLYTTKELTTLLTAMHEERQIQ
jgi:hypothetical protein